ncbi:energy-coupling factor ABC transporter substrate-binding protein [Granulicoccus sp. GXG6511]|uniref:energy-coupling factor ABC transporter substrate-binding protein n=1 Tax=Granulicoccus sp. GXG6511 TaxID=3381351 RepID=UPI003D7C7EC6
MSEQAARDVSTSNRRGFWVTVGLLVALVALWLLPMIVAPAPKGADEHFLGTDAQATEMVEDTGYEPWFNSIFAPASEVESGLFALQAAIGSGILFFVIGHFHGRTRAERAIAQQSVGRPVSGPGEH